MNTGKFIFAQMVEFLPQRVFDNFVSKYQGNISQAAKELGLTRAALYRRLEKYGL